MSVIMIFLMEGQKQFGNINVDSVRKASLSPTARGCLSRPLGELFPQTIRAASLIK